jgi:uncharacterized protein (DUF1499 family)
MLLPFICVVVLVASLLINRMGWVDPRLPLLAIGLAMGIWLLMAIYIVLTSVWAMYQQSWVSDTGAVIPLVVAMVPIVLVVALVLRSQQVPSIHDITTDTQLPPVFVYAQQVRHPSHNATVYSPTNAPLQNRTYPDVQPLLLTMAPARVLLLAEQLINTLGWQLHGIDTETTVVEAYDTSVVFGFVDDVVIRITPIKGDGEEGSRVDMRSASRIGVSDLGANAKRIANFLNELKGLSESQGVVVQ